MKIFENTTALAAATLTAGQMVETKGYHTAGDGGGARYLIVGARAADGYGDHTLANGNVAELQHEGVVIPEWFGYPDNGALVRAIEYLPATGGTIKLGPKDYRITGEYHHTMGDYKGNLKPNIKLLGSGMPQPDSGETRFVSGSGTVIQGCLVNYADGFEAYDLGVDVGSYVTTTYAADFGPGYPEGFVAGTHRFQGTPTDLTSYIQNVSFGNIKVIGVNNLNHMILAEFINGLSHGYCECIGGYHGYVCKSTNVNGGNVWAYHQAGDAYIIKSDQYTLAQNINIDSIMIGKRGSATVTAQGFFQSTTGGYITNRVTIGRIQGWKCKELLTRIGDPEPITDISVGEIIGDDITGNGISILGDMRRINIGSHIISNTTANGVYVDSTSGETIKIGSGTVTNAGSNGYYFEGENHVHGDIEAINCTSWGVNRVSGVFNPSRIRGSGNGSGLTSSGLELLTSANLVNSWVNNTGTWPFQVVYADGVVHVRGTIKSGTAGTVATLPVGYRPAAGVLSFVTVALDTGVNRTFAHVDIDTAGVITVANFAGLGGTGCVVAFNFSFIL